MLVYATTAVPFSVFTLKGYFDTIPRDLEEAAMLDGAGRERLRVSRLRMDQAGTLADYAIDPKFARAVAEKVYFGPVYFRLESEPYMTISMAGPRRSSGVAVAEAIAGV